MIKRSVLKKQARKARAEPGNTELCVEGNFTEDREEWQKELQRHCEEVYTDLEETKEVQENRIDCSKKTCDQLFSKWYTSCIILRQEQEREPEIWKKLHVGGLNGTSCQHLQVMATNQQQKHWEWQEDRTPMLKHGSVVRPTMYLASMDIKTALGMWRNLWKTMIHTGGSPRPSCERCRCWKFNQRFNAWRAISFFNRCLRQESVEAPRVWENLPVRFGLMWKKDG